jgi:hypothetical protein
MAANTAPIPPAPSLTVCPGLPLQVGDDPLDGPRYSCNAPDELVERLCAELHIRMSNYLRLA